MDLSQVLADLRSEQEQINAAIAALEGLATTPASTVPVRKGGRPRKAKTPATSATATVSEGVHPKRHMSPAARKRISEAAKKRWAKLKRAKKAEMKVQTA